MIICNTGPLVAAALSNDADHAGNDQINGKVVFGLGDGLVYNLERVDARDDHSAGAGPPVIVALGKSLIGLS